VIVDRLARAIQHAPNDLTALYNERVKRALLLAPLPLLGCPPCPSPGVEDASLYVSFDGGADNLDAQCAQLCEQYEAPSSIDSCELQIVDAGVGHLSCSYTFSVACGGRRPAQWARVDVSGYGTVGAWLAEAAQLEAASVPAFEILAAELRAHDAPPSLIGRALASADDERRHATIMARLAGRYRAKPGPVRVVRRAARDLETIACENAVEGLVREAYGARVAIDPIIAADESRHAALAADLHAWVRPRLSLAARRRVDEARDLARAALLAECSVEPPRALRNLGVVPDATRAVDLARVI
jgi:hypothetical protein